MNQQLNDYSKIEWQVTIFKRKRLILKQLYTAEFLILQTGGSSGVPAPSVGATVFCTGVRTPATATSPERSHVGLTPQSFHAPTPK